MLNEQKANITETMKIMIVSTGHDKLTELANKVERFLETGSFSKKCIAIRRHIWKRQFADILFQEATKQDVIFWMLDGNDWFSVKQHAPKATVVGFMQTNGRCFVDVLNQSLQRRDNLTVAISESENGEDEYLLYDPLGTKWFEGVTNEYLIRAIYKRAEFLIHTHRENTYPSEERIEVSENEEFFQYVRDVAEIFHKTIQHSDGVTRLLGNASFRSMKPDELLKGVVFASERDVDKALISKDTFVPAWKNGNDGKTYFSGCKKPSKDTIVQLKLYDIFKNVNYIVHSHCYVQNAPFTETPVPCGALEEIDEIVVAIARTGQGNDSGYYAVNLYGHGCIIMADTVKGLRQTEYYTRNLPETLQSW